MPFADAFDRQGYRFRRTGKGFKARTKHSEKEWEVGGVRRKCDRGVSHVSGTALDGSVNWPWRMERVVKIKRWESKILCLTLRPRMSGQGRLGELHEENIEGDEGQMDEGETADDGREEWRINFEDRGLVNDNGDVPVMKAPRSIRSWRTTSWWRNRSA